MERETASIIDATTLSTKESNPREYILRTGFLNARHGITEDISSHQSPNRKNVQYHNFNCLGSDFRPEPKEKFQTTKTPPRSRVKESNIDTLRAELIRLKAEQNHSNNLREQVSIMAEQSNIRDQENNDKIIQLSQRMKEQNAIEQHLRDEIVRIQQEKLEEERRFNVQMTGADAKVASLNAACQKLDSLRLENEAAANNNSRKLQAVQRQYDHIIEDHRAEKSNWQNTIEEKEREFHRCRAALSEAQISNQQLEMKMGEIRGQLEMKDFELQLLHNSKKEQDALTLKQKEHLQALSDEKSALEVRVSLISSLEDQMSTLQGLDEKLRQALAEQNRLQDSLQTSQAELTTIKNELKQKREQLSEMNIRMEGHQKKLRNQTSLENELQTVKRQLSQLKTELKKAQKDYQCNQQLVEETQEKMLVADTKFVSMEVDTRREVQASLLLLDNLVAQYTATNENISTPASISTDESISLLLSRLHDSCLCLHESLRSERAQYGSMEEQSKAQLRSMQNMETALERTQEELQRSQAEQKKLFENGQKQAEFVQKLKSRIEAEKHKEQRYLDILQAHVSRVYSLLGSTSTSQQGHLRSANDVSHSLEAFCGTLEAHVQHSREEIESTQARLHSMELCYRESKQDSEQARLQLNSEREHLVEAHRQSLESTKQELQHELQSSLNDAGERLRQAELFYERSRTQDCDQLLETCRILYRAYVPLSRRAHELAFQKRLLQRQVDGLQHLQLQVSDLARAMTGHVDANGAPISDRVGQSNVVFGNGAHRRRKGIALFRVAAISVLAASRLCQMGQRSFYLGERAPMTLVGDWSCADPEAEFSGRNARLLPPIYVRNDQFVPEIQQRSSNSTTSVRQISFINLGRILFHFDRNVDAAGSKNLRRSSVHNDLFLELGQGLLRSRSPTIADLRSARAIEAEDALVLIRTMTLTLARRLQQMKHAYERLNDSQATLEDSNTGLTIERDQLLKSSRKDAGVILFLEQRVQEIQSEVMQMVPSQRHQNVCDELHQLKVSYYELQNRRQRLAAEYDVQTHELNQLHKSNEAAYAKLHTRNNAIRQLQSLLQLRAEEVSAIQALLKRSNECKRTSSGSSNEKCRARDEVQIVQSTASTAVERDHNLQLIRRQIEDLEKTMCIARAIDDDENPKTANRVNNTFPVEDPETNQKLSSRDNVQVSSINVTQRLQQDSRQLHDALSHSLDAVHTTEEHCSSPNQ